MAAANWGLPTTSSTYVNLIDQLDARLDDAAKQFYSADGDPTAPPHNAIRWNSTNNNWQLYSTASTAWAALATTYNITATAATQLATGRAFSITGDVTATAITFNGTAAVALSSTLANSGVTAGSYGSNAAVPVLGIDAKGRVTSASTQALGNMALQTASSIAVTGGTLSGVAITLPFGTGSTTEGVIQWVTASDAMAVGSGAATVTFSHNTGTATLSNKTLDNTSVITVKGTSFTLQDPTTTTKQARFIMSGITAANTRSWTFPDADGTFVGLTNTQTLTNKTLTSPTINTPSITGGSLVTTAVDLSGGSLIAPLAVTPAQTANGSISWDSDGFLLTIGDGTGRKTLVDIDSAQTITNKTVELTANLFTLKDATDPTKKIQFTCASTTSGVTRIFGFPAITVDTNIAVVGNVAQTFTGNTTFSNATGHFGSSTATGASYKLGGGATTNGSTKTITIGAAGVSGSTTVIDIGSAVSGAVNTISFNGVEGIKLPIGTTAQRPTGVDGKIRYNTDLDTYEGYRELSANWEPFSQSLYTYRNLLINANMDVWQRGTSFTATGYAADRWYVFKNGGTMSVTRSTDVPDTGSLYSIQYAGTSVTGGPAMLQDIEPEIARAAVGNKVTVSFWAKQTTGSSQLTVGISYFNSYNNSLTLTSVQALAVTLTGSWAKYVVNFTTTMPTQIGNGMRLAFYKIADPDTSTWLISRPQLEVGTFVTPFEDVPPQINLANCYRYYFRSIAYGDPWKIYAGGIGWATTTGVFHFSHPVPMRIIPTLSYNLDTNKLIIANYSVNAAITSMIFNTVSTDSSTIIATVASGITSNMNCFMQSNNSSNTWIAFNSEYY